MLMVCLYWMLLLAGVCPAHLSSPPPLMHHLLILHLIQVLQGQLRLIAVPRRRIRQIHAGFDPEVRFLSMKLLLLWLRQRARQPHSLLKLNILGMALLLQEGLLGIELVLLREFRLQIDFDFGSISVRLELDWSGARRRETIRILNSKIGFRKLPLEAQSTLILKLWQKQIRTELMGVAVEGELICRPQRDLLLLPVLAIALPPHPERR